MKFSVRNTRGPVGTIQSEMGTASIVLVEGKFSGHNMNIVLAAPTQAADLARDAHTSVEPSCSLFTKWTTGQELDLCGSACHLVWGPRWGC